jgi:hypothetical protein
VHQSAHVLQPSKLQHGPDEVNGCVPLLPDAGSASTAGGSWQWAPSVMLPPVGLGWLQ